MAGKKLEVTEMRDAKVDYISLVKRGANRIPFRVIKSAEKESVMLDLNNLGQSIGRALKGDRLPTGPQILGIATLAQEGAALEAVKKSLADNGFASDKVEKFEDGSVMFRQQDGELEGHSLVRLSENLALVVKGFSPYNDDVNNDFLANVKAQGFYSGVRSAADAFITALYGILRESDSPSDASASTSKLFSDFQTYVKGLVSDLPTKAFKMDLELSEALVAVKKAEGEPAAEPVVAAAEGEQASAEAAGEPVAAEPAAQASAEGEPESVEKGEKGKDKAKDMKPADSEKAPAEGEKKPTEEEEAAAKEKAKKEEDGLAQVLKAIEGLGTAVKSITEGQETLALAQKSLTDRVDEVARKSEDALKAVGGVVIGSAPGEDSPVQTVKAQKSDEDPRTGCFDTAFLPQAKR